MSGEKHVFSIQYSVFRINAKELKSLYGIRNTGLYQ
jgi:hypothetical protein